MYLSLHLHKKALHDRQISQYNTISYLTSYLRIQLDLDLYIEFLQINYLNAESKLD